ncbi:MAG: YkgJ family cysteine cluster protein [Desulfurococcaceae archaeon]
MNTLIEPGSSVQYSCIRCGRCCSSGPNVALTVFDICRLAKYTNSAWRELAGKYFYVVVADYIPVAVLRGIRDRCAFLRTEGAKAVCTIYPARPLRCRLYPFIPISPGESSKLEVSAKCPGVGQGGFIAPPWEDLKSYLEEVKKHYEELFQLIFRSSYEPVKALEIALDRACSEV